VESQQSLFVLVATLRTQGQRANDFCFAQEGEVVCTQLTYDRDRGDPDRPCGCLRSLSGIDTMLATTTVRVAPYRGDRDAYVAALTGSFHFAGWTIPREVVGCDADLLLAIAARYPVDTVLEWRNGQVAVRHEVPESRESREASEDLPQALTDEE